MMTNISENEIDEFVADLSADVISGIDADGGHFKRTLTSGRTLLVLPVRGQDADYLGLLVAVFSRNAGKSSSFNPSMLANILGPAVDVIGESLLLAQRLEQASRRNEIT